MSPILPGLVVMCWRARHRPVSRANPRSPRQRSDRWRALRARVLISRSWPPGGWRTGMWMPIPAPSYPGAGQGRQARCGGGVERGERVGAGGGDVVHRARLGRPGPQREAVRGEDGLDVAAVGVRFPGIPQAGDLALGAEGRLAAAHARHRLPQAGQGPAAARGAAPPPGCQPPGDELHQFPGNVERATIGDLVEPSGKGDLVVRPLLPGLHAHLRAALFVRVSASTSSPGQEQPDCPNLFR